jgi:cation diffusion facilitator CzcD-associated flavoprotein CzcO
LPRPVFITRSGVFVSASRVAVVVIGAGPYGLSIAAHLRTQQLSFRIFGEPMASWRDHMPKGMSLKSEGFASDLYDPEGRFTLRHYCTEKGFPYNDVGAPIPLETFSAYGLEFQRRMVPELETTLVTHVSRVPEGFSIITAKGDRVLTSAVVVATGIAHFDYIPAELASVGPAIITHSYAHSDLAKFSGKSVAVVGAGSSAVDTAALLHESGAKVALIARRDAINFHAPTVEPRPLLQRVLTPRSGLGLGWRSRLCTDAPLLFHKMPESLRLRAVRNHLGPAPGWFMTQRVVGRFPLHLGTTIESLTEQGGRARLALRGRDGTQSEVTADHVIAATGYRPALERLPFLEPRLRDQIRTAGGAPVLNDSFESSVSGLYMVGLASANSFGPLARFAYGAGFTARRLTRKLAARRDVREFVSVAG